jgi:hypothetical protein
LIDQSNVAGVAYGGAIHIYQGDDLMGEDAACAPATTIDLAGATAQLCMASTGPTRTGSPSAGSSTARTQANAAIEQGYFLTRMPTTVWGGVPVLK